MGRESIEGGELSSPLVAEKNDGVCASGGGGGQSGGSSATGVVVLSTLVAVSGSYVFGSAVSSLPFGACDQTGAVEVHAFFYEI